MLPKKKIKYDEVIQNPPKIGTKFLEYGFDRIEELMNKTDEKTKYLPRTIDFDDMDKSIFNYVNDGHLKLVLDGEKVPTFYLDNDRWGELEKTWKFVDNDKNVPTPYITVRRTGKSKGTRIGNKIRIPQPMKFAYVDVPILDNGEVVYLRFKMPEPINIDLTYDVNLFTKYRVDVNLYDKIILRIFSSYWDYIWVKGTPLPLFLDDIGEPHSMENIDGDRFYLSTYKIKLQGLIRDESEYELVKTFRKKIISYTAY